MSNSPRHNGRISLDEAASFWIQVALDVTRNGVCFDFGLMFGEPRYRPLKFYPFFLCKITFFWRRRVYSVFVFFTNTRVTKAYSSTCYNSGTASFLTSGSFAFFFFGVRRPDKSAPQCNPPTKDQLNLIFPMEHTGSIKMRLFRPQ